MTTETPAEYNRRNFPDLMARIDRLSALRTAADESGVEERARDLLKDLIGPAFSDTTLRVATDYLKQEWRFAHA